jgi:hypothetical protein
MLEASREERVVRNELAFREANESLRGVFERASPREREDAYPFLCECGDRACAEVVQLSLEVYASVRAHPARFLILPGHKQLEAERVVDAGDGYEIVEKGGAAGEIARAGWAELSSEKLRAS